MNPTPTVPHSTYKRAKEVAALTSAFCSDCKIVYDPSAPTPPGTDPSSGKFDEAASGAVYYEVPHSTPDSASGPYMIYGHVNGANLGIPASAFDVYNGQDYLIRPRLVTVFNENVAKLDIVHQQLTQPGTNHYNRGCKVGPNLVAFGDFPAGQEITNTEVVLIWSSQPFNQRQELP